MKKVLISLIILLIGTFQWSMAQTHLIGKSFKAVIGSVCEETTQPDPCAGYMIYLVLDFQKNHVLITEKNVRSCSEYTPYHITANWKPEANGNISLSYSSKLPEDSFLKGFRLKLKGNMLLGYRKDWQGEMVEYKFEKNK